MSKYKLLSHVQLFATPWTRQSLEFSQPDYRSEWWWWWFSCSVVSDSWTLATPLPARVPCPWDSLGKNTEWVAISFSRGSSRPKDRTQVSCIAGRFCTNWATREEIFPNQGLNPGLPHRRQILYQMSHKGSPRILEWVAYTFSSGSSWPRNQTWVSCTAGRLFTGWATVPLG